MHGATMEIVLNIFRPLNYDYNSIYGIGFEIPSFVPVSLFGEIYDPVCSDGIHPLLCTYFVSRTATLRHGRWNSRIKRIAIVSPV